MDHERDLTPIVSDVPVPTATELSLLQPEPSVVPLPGFEVVLDHLNEPFVTLDNDWCFTYVNPAAAKYFNMPREHFLGRCAWDVIPGIQESEQGCLCQEAKRNGVSRQLEYRSSLTGHWVQVNFCPNPAGCSITFRDVNEQREAEAALRRSEERFRCLLNTDNTIVWMTNAAGEFIEPQDSWARYTGQDWAEHQGFGWAEAIHPEDRAHVQRTWTKALVEKVEHNVFGRIWHAAKRAYHHCEARAVPLWEPDGGVREWVGLCLDVEDRVRAERQVRERMEELEALMDVMPFAVIRADNADATQVTANAAAYAMLKVQPGTNLSQVQAPGAVPFQFGFYVDGRRLKPEELPLRRTLREGVDIPPVEMEIRFEDGDVKHYFVGASPLFDERRQIRGGLAVMVDITERIQAEHKAFKAEERFRTAQENSLSSFTLWQAVRDETGKIIDFEREYVNPVAGKMLRTNPAELLGSRFKDELLNTSVAQDIFNRFVHVVESGVPYDAESFMDVAGVRGWFHVTTVRLGDGVAVSSTNITDRKALEQELRMRVDELAESDRRKDEFLALLAHELRNPLAPIRTALHLLNAARGNQEIAEHARETMERQVSHMVRLIDDLLDVSRISRGKVELRKEKVKLEDIIVQAVETSRPNIDGMKHRLQVQLPLQPIYVQGDAVRLVQVLSNLLNNASKFTPMGGELSVRTELVSGPARDRVEIRVRDNGVGIEPEVQGRIFDMFVQIDRTLHHAQGGLGLGLTLVKGLLDMHGGNITVVSDGHGLGSEFIVALPVDSVGVLTPVPEPVSKPATGLKVLVVDDNVDAANTMAMLLKVMGNQVATANDGLEALEVLEQFLPEVVLQDIGMPDMSGYEVAEKIRETKGDKAPLLLALTGYGSDEDRQKSREAGFAYHLVKPVDMDVLSSVLNECQARLRA